MKETGKKKIAIITDGLTYGEGLAASFTERGQATAAEIVAAQKIGEKDTDFSSVIAAVKPSGRTPCTTAASTRRRVRCRTVRRRPA